MGIYCFRYTTLQYFLLNFVRLQFVKQSSISWSFRAGALLFSMSVTTLQCSIGQDFVEGAFSLVIQVVHKDNEQYWLKNETWCTGLVPGHKLDAGWAIDCYHLTLAIKENFSSSNNLFFQCVLLHLTHEDVVGNSLKSLSEVEIHLLLYPSPSSQSFNCRKHFYLSRKIALNRFVHLLVCHRIIES